MLRKIFIYIYLEVESASICFTWIHLNMLQHVQCYFAAGFEIDFERLECSSITRREYHPEWLMCFLGLCKTQCRPPFRRHSILSCKLTECAISRICACILCCSRAECVWVSLFFSSLLFSSLLSTYCVNPPSYLLLICLSDHSYLLPPPNQNTLARCAAFTFYLPFLLDSLNTSEKVKIK